ncbi:MAG: LPS-assembly protein LptD [Thermoguttaceae bacterium]|nr:LPS-assembly protein LptD [Thermoguttaceae bacterium]
MSQRFDVARVVANRSLAFHRVLARATKGTARLIENATLTATFFLALFLCAFSSVRANFPGDGNLSRRSLWFSDNAAVDDPWASDFQGTTRGQSDDFLEPSLGSSSSDWPEDPEEPEEVDPSERFDTMRVGESTLYAPRRDVSSSNIVISAQYGWKGDSDEYGDVYVLYGDCQISQDEGSARAPIAVVWISNESGEEGSGAVGARVRAYLERDNSDGLRLDLNQVCLSAKTNGKAWLGEFSSLGETDLRIALPGETQIQPNEVYFRALNFLEEETSDSQSDDATGAGGSIESVLPSAPTDAPLLESALLDEEKGEKATRPSNLSRSESEFAPGWCEYGDGDTPRFIAETVGSGATNDGPVLSVSPERFSYRFVSRYETPLSIRPGESAGDGKNVWIVSNGFTLIVQGIDFNGTALGETLELSADSAVVWTAGNANLANYNDVSELENDFEIYLDGNVAFREGNNVVYAKKMYYDIKNRVGIIEDAEMVAEVPDMDGAFFRLGASRIFQEGPDSLTASDAWISTSLMGRPTYRLLTDSLVVERRRRPLYNALTGAEAIDPVTGRPLTEEKQYAVAENNFVTLGNLPVFYWPWAAMDIKDRALYLKSLKFGGNGVLGTQVRTSWDLYQLLNAKNRPDGTEWSLDLDYLSKRGLGHGSTFRYERDSLWNWNSRAVGLASYYGVNDRGRDNLGHGRQNLTFEHKYRYRAIWKHRQELDFERLKTGHLDGCSLCDGWTLTGQFGKSSDRNFIPEYFEDEWNSSSNPETRLELKRTINNRSLTLNAAVRTDSFYTQTNWLPKLDHFWIGQALCDSPLVWYEHTKIGFAQFKTTDSPYDPTDRALFRYLDWELTPDSTSNLANVPGTKRLSKDSLAFSTRQEIDAPLQLGPVKTTPYALGEYGFWGNGVESKNISRLYGRLGVRFNLPIWKVDSNVESKTWYLNGLAHKMNFVVDASYSDANKDYNKLVLYDQIDDWQVQDFRRRYSATTFSGAGVGGMDAIPVRFDERYYAIRQGALAGNVASPSSELVDDLQLVRLGWNNRWQTKRGPVGGRRVIDWITLDAGISLYPKKSENFGKLPGLIDYDARWQVGDRFAVLSSGLYDVWGSGQKITRVGVQRGRPTLSSCYLGVDRLSGPIDSTYLNFGLTYRTSEKWGIGFSNSFDLSEGYNIGQKLTVSRIGESFVITLGASRNESKDNWGVNLSIEPVFFFDKGKRNEGLLGLGNM